ncbi:unnamed protein product, partial [Scytosiphon promiscuus]
HYSPQDAILQSAVRASVCDQYSALSAEVFKGRNQTQVPYASIEELMSVLEDLAWNETEATAVRREVVHAHTSGQGIRGASSGGSGSGTQKQYGSARYQGSTVKRRVMSVQEEMEDEEQEFERVYQVHQEHNSGVHPR